MGRPLSDIEKAIWLVDQEVRQNFVMVAHLSHRAVPLTGPVLRKALDMIQLRYPPLNWKIKQGEVPEFVSDNVPPIPMHIIERKGDDHWIEEAEMEMEKAFPFTGGPLVRVVLLAHQEKSDLLVTFCHIASDATSGVLIVKKILSIVGKLLHGETVAPEPPLPVPPSSIEILRKNMEFNTDTPDTTNSACQDTQKSIELPPDEDVPPEKRITRIIHRVLSKTETEALCYRSKRENTTVHGVLCAALLHAVVREVRISTGVNTGKKEPLLIGCITAVNIRHLFCKCGEENIGYYISFAIHNQLINEDDSLWNAARDIKAAIKREVDSRKDIKAILGVGEALKEFPTSLDLVRAIHNSNPPVAITNLGRLDIPGKYGDLTLKALHFPVAIHFDTKNGLATAITTFRGRMTINFLYAEPYISKKRANIICENMMKRLKDAIKE